MLASLREHAGRPWAIEKLQTSTYSATRNTVGAMVNSHCCVMVTEVRKKEEKHVPFPLYRPFQKGLTVTQLAKEKVVCRFPAPSIEGPAHSSETVA